MKNNIILQTDSYKLTHWKQYSKNTTKIYSYLESRGGKFDKTVFFGLQYYMKKYLSGIVVTKQMVDEAQEFSLKHFGQDLFNYDGWLYIVNKYEGKLPIRICAVKEGSLVNISNVLMTIENTDDKCFWLTNFIETLLMKLWYPCTIATNSFYAKQIINKYLNETATDTNPLFKLHDFGYRGVSSEEQAGIGGMSHLLNFMGSDTLAGILYAKEYYNADVCGFSVPASEHSIATSFGKGEGEKKYVLNMLNNFPTGIVSLVGDSYNIYNFAELLNDKDIKDKILSRDGTTVLRPDSGNPEEVISKLIDILWNNFGGVYNDKGYKVLDPHIRIIQGDGIDLEMIEKLLKLLKSKKFSAENIVFGSGGGLLQKFDRDTQQFAIKCSYAIIDGVETDVQKDPITSKSKKSKKGKLKLYKNFNNSYSTYSSCDNKQNQFSSYLDSLVPVFENGVILEEYTFEEIKENLNSF